MGHLCVFRIHSILCCPKLLLLFSVYSVNCSDSAYVCFLCIISVVSEIIVGDFIRPVIITQIATNYHSLTHSVETYRTIRGGYHLKEFVFLSMCTYDETLQRLKIIYFEHDFMIVLHWLEILWWSFNPFAFFPI